jgi:hypothetical protein
VKVGEVQLLGDGQEAAGRAIDGEGDGGGVTGKPNDLGRVPQCFSGGGITRVAGYGIGKTLELGREASAVAPGTGPGTTIAAAERCKECRERQEHKTGPHTTSEPGEVINQT